MSYEDTVQGLKVVATISLGTYTGAALYSMVAVQPSLIQEENVPAATSVRLFILLSSFIFVVLILSDIQYSSKKLIMRCSF